MSDWKARESAEQDREKDSPPFTRPDETLPPVKSSVTTKDYYSPYTVEPDEPDGDCSPRQFPRRGW